jgi:hypothetical protein
LHKYSDPCTDDLGQMDTAYGTNAEDPFFDNEETCLPYSQPESSISNISSLGTFTCSGEEIGTEGSADTNDRVINSLSESLSDTLRSDTLYCAFINGDTGSYTCTACNHAVFYGRFERQQCLYKDSTRQCTTTNYVTCQNNTCKNYQLYYICFACLKPQKIKSTLRDLYDSDVSYLS